MVGIVSRLQYNCGYNCALPSVVIKGACVRARRQWDGLPAATVGLVTTDMGSNGKDMRGVCSIWRDVCDGELELLAPRWVQLRCS